MLYNLGLKDLGAKLVESIDKTAYNLTDEERRVQFEKIKELKDEKDNLSSDISNLPFNKELRLDPCVVESIRIHESWVSLAEELLKWGEFLRASKLAKEANLHARILKDQNVFARSLHLLGQIQYVEGDSVGALRTAMVCQKYAKDISLVEQTIVSTFNLLFEFGKLEDCERLIDPSITMLSQIRDEKKKTENSLELNQKTKSGANSSYEQERNPILPLEFALNTAIILKAILNLK